MNMMWKIRQIGEMRHIIPSFSEGRLIVAHSLIAVSSWIVMQSNVKAVK